MAIRISGNIIPLDGPDTDLELTTFRQTEMAPEKTNAPELLLYPNPSPGFVEAQWTGAEEGTLTLRLVDLYGRVVWEEKAVGKTTNHRLELSPQVRNGTYIFQIWQAGKLYTQKRLVLLAK